jgi:hypothetical protein
MKADLPATPKLRIPRWVPGPVAAKARELSQHFPPMVSPALMRALVSNKRMRWVWTELSKRQGDGYLHPARPLKGSGDDPQGFGMATLFAAIVMFMQDADYRVSYENRQEAQTARDAYALMAQNLRTLTRTFAELLPSDHRLHQRFQQATGEDVRKLNDAAGVLERLAQEGQGAMLELPARDRGNALARNITGELVSVCRRIFGKQLYGCVAIIASVALESDISESTIRTWHPRG